MIIWINGAFGSGKTTISQSLKQMFEEAFIYDPELLGSLLNKIFPSGLQQDDFQDYLEWRQWNCDILRKLSKSYQGIIIVPMTIYKAKSYLEIIEKLKQEGVPLLHIVLDVSKDTILSRLAERNDGTLMWGASKIDKILEAFEHMPATEKLAYENIAVEDAVIGIMERWEIYLKSL